MLMHFAFTLACLGYIEQARSKMEEALSEGRRLRNAHALAGRLDFANRLDWITRSPVVHTEDLLALATEHGFPFYLGWALSYRGRSLIAQGQAQEGLGLLTRGLAGLRATGSVAGMSMPLPGLPRPMPRWSSLLKYGTALQRPRTSSKPPRSGSWKLSYCIGCRAIC